MTSRSPRKTLTVLIGLLLATSLSLIATAPANAETITYGMTWHLKTTRFEAKGTDKTAYVGNNGTLKLYTDWASDAYYGDYAPPHIYLQHKVGSGSWHNLKRVGFSVNNVIETTTPAYKTGKTSQSVSYRFASLPYTATATQKVLNTSYSKSVKITYENQAKYTGVKKQYYSMVKAYCKYTAIHVSSLTSAEAGEYDSGSLLIKISSKVAGYSTVFKKSVVIHECAHEHQFTNYGKTYDGWEQMEKAAAKVYVNDPTPAGVTPTLSGSRSTYKFVAYEHGADCAALSVNPKGYLGYGGYCNPTELAEGKALLHGRKY